MDRRRRVVRRCIVVVRVVIGFGGVGSGRGDEDTI